MRSQVNTSHIGCIGELIVTVDLMRRGYEIFRAISPGCGCDLIAMKNGTSQRIEVTKGQRNYKVDKRLHFTKHNPDRYDIIAVWEDEGTITYFPALEGQAS